ncbi:HAMP domain-containing histidine kinase [Actinospica durhamensis]|uniref:histidine kinase n=1 Tax=Actinospica durhamensis TaxID=1508375 RepID=A0A941EVR3_9ACTN|nr:HAMP domain-containing sensor histidine kinase [Actinospica durhamensis]MBR7834814.1 HAMP domain-containing histidine kinase [Actinospica durhamensis]
MTRRIAGTFIALLSTLMVLAVVPLGLSIASNERTSFRFDADSAARTVANAAEEHLSDHHSDAEMLAALSTAAARGDCATVYDSDGVELNASKCPHDFRSPANALARRVLGGDHGENPDEDLTTQEGQWLLVGVPVGDDGQVTGAVVYARSMDPTDDRIEAMWGWLAITGFGVLALAAYLSVRLARWVSRPLEGLGDAAARLGAGDLSVRADPQTGPEQVRRLAETFDWMAERIETLVRGHRSWLADVSHQLRTPLTALRLRLDLLAADVPDEHAAAEFAAAQEEIARLSRLVDGLLAVARTEAAVPQRKPVRIDTVARERLAAWEPVAAERGVRLSEETEPVTAALGAGDLEQMLDNLVANALEAVGESGHVRIEALRRDGRALIRVVDDGPGLSDERKQAAFHRYGHPEPRGHGLGLAIVQRLAAVNGGDAFLRDTPGGGLTAELDLGPAT